MLSKVLKKYFFQTWNIWEVIIEIILKTEKQIYFIVDISFYIATVDFTDYSR